MTENSQNEIDKLQESLSKAQERIEALEQERKLHQAKIWELSTANPLVTTTTSETALRSKLIHKALMVAELSTRVEELELLFKTAKYERDQFLKERDANKVQLVELSRIFRASSLSTAFHGTVSLPVDEEVVTTDHALFLAMTHMKEKVEGMDDERQSLLQEISSLRSSPGPACTCGSRNDAGPQQDDEQKEGDSSDDSTDETTCSGITSLDDSASASSSPLDVEEDFFINGSETRLQQSPRCASNDWKERRSIRLVSKRLFANLFRRKSYRKEEICKKENNYCYQEEQDLQQHHLVMEFLDEMFEQEDDSHQQ